MRRHAQHHLALDQRFAPQPQPATLSAIALMADDDLQREIKKQGDRLQVIATEKFNIGDKDMTAQLLRAKSSGAQAILIGAPTADSIDPNVLKALANRIAYNKGPGVWIFADRSPANRIQVNGNEIHDNLGLGIDLHQVHRNAAEAGAHLVGMLL